ncbi:4-alpha-glucanotransferase [Seongchinamella sediminis]|uniref:4-alpha-glucanotransferase n=1 Tax=Seongchinamella sediminis TaxID=2283635 RepID=A0A3L7E2E9_9GAMM|nr:4-alpha-glucanotransferase [Seongchinamella sediminis]RLQ22481.1 4-alpha-glucanotransferase [Seongchinamella sediminis]
MNSLEKLLYLRGVAAEYLNYSGDRITVPTDVRLQLLAAMGHDVNDPEGVERAIYQLDALPWKCWLQPFTVVSAGAGGFVDIRVHPRDYAMPIDWRLQTEQGEEMAGQCVPAGMTEVGDYHLEGVRYSARRLELPPLPPGYHQLALWNQDTRVEAVLAACPPRCYQAGGRQRGPVAGISCQLYTLRSARNWGIGDFSDLEELIEYSAAAGLDIIGLNPLHAPDMSAADFASPYSPSDRRFLNPLYVDPTRVPDYGNSAEVASLLADPATRRRLAELQTSPLVDYSGVAALKFAVFDAMYRHFCAGEGDEPLGRTQAFDDFVSRGGAPLRAFSVHESQRSRLPLDSAAEPRFHQYLQWLAEEQLARCQALARVRGMKIGLLRDLAVGAVEEGAEVTTNRALFCSRASIGAPPDPLAPRGQDWNLPPPDPVALRADNFRHFIDLLRANMAHCGALRIDHVMGLWRLWWCLPGMDAGAYVFYPFEELLAILRLESHRNECAVIGEDLGVVPDELRVRMSATAVYGNRLLYFQRDPDQQFSAPQQHQADALLMVTNHDVATLAGWWNTTDLQLRSDCGALGDAQPLQASLAQRQEDKHRLLHWLQRLQLLPLAWEDPDAAISRQQPFDLGLCAAILRASARSSAELLLFQLDDLQLLEAPVNIPGTCREYPNWRRKQRRETASLFADPDIQALLTALVRERAQGRAKP